MRNRITSKYDTVCQEWSNIARYCGLGAFNNVSLTQCTIRVNIALCNADKASTDLSGYASSSRCYGILLSHDSLSFTFPYRIQVCNWTRLLRIDEVATIASFLSCKDISSFLAVDREMSTHNTLYIWKSVYRMIVGNVGTYPLGCTNMSFWQHQLKRINTKTNIYRWMDGCVYVKCGLSPTVIEVPALDSATPDEVGCCLNRNWRWRGIF